MLSIEGKDGIIDHVTQHFIYEDTLSQCYTLNVQLRLDSALDFKQIVFRNAHLSYLSPAGERKFIHGFVTDLDIEYDPAKKYHFNTVTIRPFLYLLRFSRQFRVFNKQSYLSQAQLVVNNLLRERSLPANRAEFNVTDSLLTTEFNRSLVQHADNDLAFFEQTLQMGARYYFVQHENFEQLVVIDTPQALPNRDQVIDHLPDKKDAVTQNEVPVFYQFGLNQTLSRKAKPFYFDPFDPEGSRARTGKSSQEEIGITSIPCYAPSDQYDLIAARLTDQLNAHQKTFTIGSYYSDLLIGEHLQVNRYQRPEPVEVFIESLKMHAEQYNDVWRFETSGLARPYSDHGAWLGPYQEPAKMPGFLRGGMIPELANINDMGQHQVQFPIDLAAGNENPPVMLRELQETSTQGGGAAHSVTGKAEVLLASQNGLNTDWMIVGSLTNEGRESPVTPENYRQSRVETTSGLGMHLTRQDASNPYGQLAVHLQDSDAHDAHISLGTNQDLLDTSATVHGIQESSSGYAKRVASGNHYETVGDVDNPIIQSALTQDAPCGFTQHHTEINVAQGSYSQVYQSDAAGMKTVQAVSATKKPILNPAIKHYIYVVPESILITALSMQLFGSESSARKEIFHHLILQTYGTQLPAGAWVYLPMVNQKYSADDLRPIQMTMKAIQTAHAKLDEATQSLYASGISLLGYAYFSLEKSAEFASTGFDLADKNFTAVKAAAEDLASLGEKAHRIGLTGNQAAMITLKSEITEATEALTQKIQTFIDKAGLPKDMATIEADTKIPWQRNILSLQDLLENKEIKGLQAIYMKGQNTALISSGLGKLLLALGVADTGFKIYKACKANPKSPLCYQAAAEDGGEFGGNVGGSIIGTRAAGAALDAMSVPAEEGVVAGSTETAGEFLGCNVALDIETAGTGFFICTAAVFATSASAGYLGGWLGEKGGAMLYKNKFTVKGNH